MTCPADYPAKAPNIKMITENGRFHTRNDGICMSISDMHPESWNPVWKVNQQVIGLLSFWLGDAEGTYGEIYEGHYGHNSDLKLSEHRVKFAKESRKAVLENEFFKKVFAGYESAIGIDTEPRDIPSWIEFDKKMEAKQEAKRLAEEKKKLEEEQKRKAEEEKKRAALRAAYQAKANAMRAKADKIKAASQKVRKLGLSGILDLFAQK